MLLFVYYEFRDVSFNLFIKPCHKTHLRCRQLARVCLFSPVGQMVAVVGDRASQRATSSALL